MTRQTIELPAHLVGDEDLAQKLALTGPNTRWLKPLAPTNEPPAPLLGQVTGAVPVVYDPAFTSHENSGSEEYATPGSRAVGQVIRLAPFTLVWLALGVGIVWLLGMEWPWLLVWWGGLTAFTYYRMDKNEFLFSRNGLERHKVDSALTVRMTELEQSHELRKMALAGYLRQLEGGHND